MRVAALFSGGKDSTFAVHLAQQWGFEVTHLVTLLPRNPESHMFHVPNLRWTPLLAEAMDIEHVMAKSSGEKERELSDLHRALSGLRIRGVVSGAVASEYQRTRVERVCHELRVHSYAPLWHKDGSRLVRELIDAGVDARVVACAAEGLDASWLGRRLDPQALLDLERLNREKGVHVSGEGGEYESIVLDAPWFQKRLEIVASRPEWQRDSGTLVIQQAELAAK
ncbi:MAG TPA: diphthine--ammonia ligase [Candidatus Thermoplasmatota archaeon]|nr:diphthine--ammonia ligase [Candidatus Thermoplasmatota archaeon]